MVRETDDAGGVQVIGERTRVKDMHAASGDMTVRAAGDVSSSACVRTMGNTRVGGGDGREADVASEKPWRRRIVVVSPEDVLDEKVERVHLLGLCWYERKKSEGISGPACSSCWKTGTYMASQTVTSKFTHDSSFL